MSLKKKKGNIVDTETGEVLTKKRAKQKILDDVLEKNKEANEKIVELGLSGNIKSELISHRGQNYNVTAVKEDFEFNKIFRVELRELIATNKLNKNARCIIGTLCGFIFFPTNAIIVNGRNPSFDEYLKLIGMSPVTLKKAFAQLEYYEVIKRVTSNGQYIIYFNPFLICGGRLVTVETYLLFKDSTYNHAEG
jgi:hypothetical protein